MKHIEMVWRLGEDTIKEKNDLHLHDLEKRAKLIVKE
jgi:hypothetical protein